MDEPNAKRAVPNPARQQRILNAASTLIAHYGYDKTTMADIAQAAGVSKGALYLHYASKDALFQGLLFHEMLRTTEDLLRRIDADPEGGTFFSLYRHGLEALAVNPLMRALTTQDKRVMGDYVRSTGASSHYAQGRAFSLDFVRQLQAAGLLRSDFAPETISYILSLVRYGLITVDDALPPSAVRPLDEVGPALADMLQRGLGAEGGDREQGRLIIAQWLNMARRLMESQIQTDTDATSNATPKGTNDEQSPDD
ncbi:MAG: TetR/AcrR family transcriptional regulator [Armatimonadetes bacterium]|nr:TetR/AcrR family transcriptional regulator [Anaerolineae bacterium]